MIKKIMAFLILRDLINKDRGLRQSSATLAREAEAAIDELFKALKHSSK